MKLKITIVLLLTVKLVYCQQWSVEKTNYPWNSWDKKYNEEPELWFHDSFRKDGSPYLKEEVDFIKQIIEE